MNLEPVKNFKKPLYAVAAEVALRDAVTGCTDPMEEVKSHFTTGMLVGTIAVSSFDQIDAPVSGVAGNVISGLLMCAFFLGYAPMCSAIIQSLKDNFLQVFIIRIRFLRNLLSCIFHRLRL